MSDACPHCKQEMPPKPSLLSIFFMSDRHYFIRLTGRTAQELEEQALAMLKDEPYGLLGPVTVLDQHGKEIRRHGYNAHVKGSDDIAHWKGEVRKWIASLEEDPEVWDLLLKGAIEQNRK